MERVLEEHTRLPLYRPFIPSELVKKLTKHHIGNRVRRMTSYVSPIGSMTETQFGICTECVKEDYRSPGYPISRRLFFVPGVLACPKHKCGLMTFCKGCQKKRYFNLLPQYMVPGLVCPCEKPLEEMANLDEAGLEAAVAIAEMAILLLKGLGPKKLSARQLRRTIAKAYSFSEEIPGPLKAVQLRNTFEQALSKEIRRHLRITQATMVRFITEGRDLVRNPIQSIAAIYAVFGSFENYSKCAEENQPNARYQLSYVHQPFVRTRPLKPHINPIKKDEFFDWVHSMTPTERENFKLEARTWMKELMRRRPEVTRKIFHHRIGDSPELRYLRWFDRDWLELQFDAADRKPPKWGIDTVDIEKVIKNVQKLSKHLKKASPQLRVFVTSLRGEIPVSSFQRLLLKSPALQTAVASEIDTDESWRERTTLYLTNKVKRFRPGSKWAQRSTFDNATFAAFRAKIVLAGICIRQHRQKLENRK